MDEIHSYSILAEFCPSFLNINLLLEYPAFKCKIPDIFCRLLAASLRRSAAWEQQAVTDDVFVCRSLFK